MAVLRLVPTSGAPIEIQQDQTVIGRDPSCDVVLTDGSVSRKHARIERRGLAWAVVDQGSANGTYIDSQRVTDVVLHANQELRFGAASFRVEIEGPSAEPGVTLSSGPEVTVQQAIPPLAGPGLPAPAVKPIVPRPAPTPIPSVAPVSKPTTPSRAPITPQRSSAPPPPPPPRGSTAPIPSVAPSAGRPVAAPAKKRHGPLFWISGGCCGCLVLLLAFFGLLAGGVYFFTSGAVAAVRGQIAEVKSGDLDAAYARLSESYKSELTREDFEALVARHPSLKDNSDSTFWKRSVQNNRANIAGTLTSTSGVHESVEYELVKEDGVWKISAIRFAGEGSAENAPPRTLARAS